MKVIVNHNGQCGNYTYRKDVEVDLPEEVVKALGNAAKIVGKVEVKEVKTAPKDKQVKATKTFTK